jgi:hypothetical protein
MTVTASSLKKLPEFKALESVYAALSPLDPEGRRKVIEAIHALLTISAGKPGAHQGQPRASKKSRRR